MTTQVGPFQYGVTVSDRLTTSGTLHWTVFTAGRTFECEIALVQEDAGYSAHATDLPGAVSEGETIAEAVANVAEALCGVLREYLDSGAIPWAKAEIEGEVVSRRRILVDV